MLLHHAAQPIRVPAVPEAVSLTRVWDQIAEAPPAHVVLRSAQEVLREVILRIVEVTQLTAGVVHQNHVHILRAKAEEVIIRVTLPLLLPEVIIREAAVHLAQAVEVIREAALHVPAAEAVLLHHPAVAAEVADGNPARMKLSNSCI